jgi:hypothetical protein
VVWSDALGSRLWSVHAASALARPLEIELEEPAGVLLM